MTRNPLKSNQTQPEKPLRPGNDARQNSSNIVKSRHFAAVRAPSANRRRTYTQMHFSRHPKMNKTRT